MCPERGERELTLGMSFPLSELLLGLCGTSRPEPPSPWSVHSDICWARFSLQSVGEAGSVTLPRLLGELVFPGVLCGCEEQRQR